MTMISFLHPAKDASGYEQHLCLSAGHPFRMEQIVEHMERHFNNRRTPTAPVIRVVIHFDGLTKNVNSSEV